MKKTLVILFTFISLVSIAQETTSLDTTRLNKFQLGLTFSPDFNFRYLKADDNTEWISKIADSMEVPKYGYTTGFNFSYVLSNKIKLGTGIIFADHGEKTKSTIELQTLNYTNHYYFLSVPVRLDYTLISKKIDVYATLGVSGNFFINHKTVMFEDGKKDPIQFTNDSDLQKFTIGGLDGIGMSAKLSTNWLFKTEVIYRQTIQSVSNGPVKKWLYSVGPNIGLYYSF